MYFIFDANFEGVKRSFSRFVLLLFAIPASVLVLLSLIVTRGDDVLFINGVNNTFLDIVIPIVTTLGEGLLFIPIIIYFLFVQFRYSILAGIVWIGHSALSQFIKRGIFNHVHRPIAVLDKSKLHFVPHVEVHGLYSFPSGHTATIFCLAMLMALIVKKKIPAIIFMILALVVGYSRIYLLQHFLMDVAGGAVIGVVFTYAAWKMLERETLPQWMNNSLGNPLVALTKQLAARKNDQKTAGI